MPSSLDASFKSLSPLSTSSRVVSLIRWVLFIKPVTLSLLVDAFIILALREFIVNVVKVNKEELTTFEAVFSSSINFNLLILSGVIIFLLIVRYLSVISSQRYIFKDEEKSD